MDITDQIQLFECVIARKEKTYSLSFHEITASVAKLKLQPNALIIFRVFKVHEEMVIVTAVLI